MRASLVKQGKRLAHCLRHSPETYGVVLDQAGSAPVASVCEALSLTPEELTSIVDSDSKSRFVIKDGRIWAAQGHSISVSVPLLEHESIEPLYHGTKRSALNSILKEGLKPQNRKHVHLSLTKETAETVAERRAGESVILKVDTEKFISDGGKLFISSNGVVLAEHIPSEFLEEA